MFFNRKKDNPIILDCYTHSHFAYTHAKINYARHYVPDWWKKTKQMSDEPTPEGVPAKTTIKVCAAIKEHYIKGIVIPLWGEFELDIYAHATSSAMESANTYEWRSSNPDFCTDSSHSRAQFAGFAGETGTNIKITSPWAIKCRELIHFTYSQPVWSQPDIIDDLTLLPGVVNFKNQFTTELNYFFRSRDVKRTLTIEPLTPMVIMHPMSERPIKLRHHYIEDENKWRTRILQRGMGMVLDTGVRTSKNLQKYYKKRNKFLEKRDKIEEDEDER